MTFGRWRGSLTPSGSWLGLSTRFICDRAPNAVVVAVDHWQGSFEHRASAELAPLLPVLYETFLISCWRYRTRIIPCRRDSQRALEELAERGLSPDVIYLDAAHEYEAVKADVAAIRRFFPQAILVGDDWDWPGVRLAATHVAEAHGATIRAYGSAWRFSPLRTVNGDSWEDGLPRPSTDRRDGLGRPSSRADTKP